MSCIGHCVMFVYREGFVDFLSQLRAAHSFTSVFLCFSSTCVPLSLLLYISFSPDS